MSTASLAPSGEKRRLRKIAGAPSALTARPSRSRQTSRETGSRAPKITVPVSEVEKAASPVAPLNQTSSLTVIGSPVTHVAVGLNVPAIAAWILGFLIYQWSVPTGPVVWQHAMRTVSHDWIGLPFPLWNSVAGASIPSFGAALVLYVAVAGLARAATKRLSR